MSVGGVCMSTEHALQEIMISPYLIIFTMLCFGLALGLGVSAISLFLGPKKPNPMKSEVYECGLPVTSTAEHKFSVKFYLTAILFILFDIESIFVYLWASAFDYLAWFGIIEIAIFIATLVLGYIYVLKREALRWDSV